MSQENGLFHRNTSAAPPPEMSTPNTMTTNNNNNPHESFSSEEPDEPDEDDASFEEEDAPISLDELLYSTGSYHAIARPVSITMALAALAAVFVNDEDTLRGGEEQFSSAYNYFELDNSGNASAGKNLAMSIGNAFIMVLVIASMTFGIVLLYKFRYV